MKKMMAMLLCGALAFTSLAGCGAGNDSSSDAESKSTVSKAEEAEEDEEESPESAAESSEQGGGIAYPIPGGGEISWYAQGYLTPHEKYADASESPFHIGLSERLGVDIDWSFPTTGSDATAFTSTMLADPSSLPDIVLAFWMDNANQYLDDEVIWDLTDYIQEYAPDYYAWLQTKPAYDRAMKTDDGRYYTFGFFREDGGWNDSYLGPVVRKDWLEECELEIPKTISEFENVIRVFHEKYGATFNASYRYKDSGFSGAFGSYANASANYGWYIKDGKVGLAQAEDEWRDYMSWQNKLWEEGLIDQDILTEDDTTIKSKIHNDKCGISVTTMGQMNNWNKEREADGKEAVWIGIPYPTADDGTISAIFGGPGIDRITTVITKNADEETMKLCLQVLNYAYTEEGFLYWNYGEEGASWEYDENSVPKFTSLVTDDLDTDPMTKYNGTTWGCPGIQATNLLYLKNSQASVEANNTWFYVYPDDEEKNLAVTSGWKWPVGTTFLTEEADELDQIAGNIPIYVEESFAAFLNGSKDIDDDAVWESYLSDLETYNLSRVLEIRQACYDRYIAR